MGKIAIVTDSTAYLPQSLIDEYGIYIVPLSVNFGEETYREGVDMSTQEFYNYLGKAKDLPTTSQPAIGDFLQLYDKLATEFDEIISIHISSGISGTLSTAFSANNMLQDITIEVIDSEISSFGLGFMVIEAAQMAQENKSMAEIKERIEWMVKNMRGYFIVDDLAHLHRGGRLNAAEFLIGSMLKIKPIIYFIDKKLQPFEKIRTKKKAIDRILELLEADTRDNILIRCSVVHADAIGEAEELAEKIKQTYSNVDVNISEFGPVLGTHTGPGTIGLTWYKIQ